MILGLNGFVWISVGTTSERREGGEGFDGEAVYSDKNDVSRLFGFRNLLIYVTGLKEISPESRAAISTVANVVRILARHNVPLTDSLIADAYAWIASSGEGPGPISHEDGERMVSSVTGMDIGMVNV